MMAEARLARETIETVLDGVYAWSRSQNYKGYNKHDGLNSPLLRAMFGWHKWTRIAAIQGVMRFPINLRPLLFVPKTYNPKGLALFALGLFDRFHADGNPARLAEAETLLETLRTIKSPGHWAGLCWGYSYPWQDPGFYAATHTPNAVVTCFVAEAFLEAYRTTQKEEYLRTVGSSLDFLLNNLVILKDTEDELCLGYMPLPMTMRVMDVSILIAAVAAQYAALSGDTSSLHTGKRLLNYVVRQQTDYGAWFYTDPPGDSLIRHDNYHTGFILDALWRYMRATTDMSWQDSYDKGLAFYAEHLFNTDGSPRWMSDRDFPHDIHGAAQGILTFSRHQQAYPGLAHRIARWAVDAMYHAEGRFSYQQGRYWTKRFTLLRWCNAWMAHGLASLLRYRT